VSVGNVVAEVVCRNSAAVVRKMVSLFLAADNRVADVLYAAQFLGFIKEKLQNPQQLIEQ
jgi:pyruvate/2-oxoglutarate dehydrogenase complex dihydrolipoamide acyltransferase (E2) component